MKVQQPPLGTPINMFHPLAQGLRSCFLLNEGRGMTAHDSVNSGVMGTLTNGAVFKAAQKGLVCSFDGTDDHIPLSLVLGGPQFASSFLDITGNWTASAWVTTTTTSGFRLIIDRDSTSASTDSQYWFGIDGGKVSIGWGNYYELFGGTTLSTNTWYHLAVTRYGVPGSWTANTYINGVLNATGTTIKDPSPNKLTICIGRQGGYSGGFWSGNINSVMMWERCLSQTEIRQLYTNTYQMFK